MKLTIGADPEFFVRRGVHCISGHVFNCGTKHKPLATLHGAVQVDGVALECNVKPSSTKEDFLSNVLGVVNDLRRIVQDRDPLCSLVARPSVFFGNKKLAALPRHIGQLGCSPDFDAYTKKILSPPRHEIPFRTGAGHIHLGWTEGVNPRNKQHFDTCCELAVELDYQLGLPSLLWDKDTRRRRLYGKAGSFRPKPYGMEYRVLSNHWLNTPGLITFVFEKTQLAFHNYHRGVKFEPYYGEYAKEKINTHDTSWRECTPGLAKELLS